MRRLFLFGIFLAVAVSACIVSLVEATPAERINSRLSQPDGLVDDVPMNFVREDTEGLGLNDTQTIFAFHQFLPLVTKAPAPPVVLWDQPASTVNVEYYANQQFPDASNYSIFQADDFLVGNSGWNVKEIFIPGGLFNDGTSLEMATSLKFQIYADNSGIPDGDPLNGGAVWSISLPTTDSQVSLLTGADGRLSNVRLQLTNPVNLTAGHYWLVFYPVMFSATGGQYGRAVSDSASGYDAVVMNPGGAMLFPPTWTSIQDASTWSLEQQDLAFQIKGN